MATVRFYTWQLNDSIWTVCSTFLLQTGYTGVEQLVYAVQNMNLLIIDWQAVPVGTQIIIPYANR